MDTSKGFTVRFAFHRKTIDQLAYETVEIDYSDYETAMVNLNERTDSKIIFREIYKKNYGSRILLYRKHDKGEYFSLEEWIRWIDEKQKLPEYSRANIIIISGGMVFFRTFSEGKILKILANGKGYGMKYEIGKTKRLIIQCDDLYSRMDWFK